MAKHTAVWQKQSKPYGKSQSRMAKHTAVWQTTKAVWQKSKPYGKTYSRTAKIKAVWQNIQPYGVHIHSHMANLTAGACAPSAYRWLRCISNAKFLPCRWPQQFSVGGVHERRPADHHQLQGEGGFRALCSGAVSGRLARVRHFACARCCGFHSAHLCGGRCTLSQEVSAANIIL